MQLVTINPETNVPTTTSLKVAEHFGKRHADVMNSIETLIEGGVRGFSYTPYIHPQNGQEYRMYEMIRPAWMILVMGFNGKKALELKQAFVDAFDAMEEALRSKQAEQTTFHIPQTFSEALMLAAKQAEQIELMEPKVEAFVDLKRIMFGEI